MTQCETQAPQWQPIETAPKDGTKIWACFKPDAFPDDSNWNGFNGEQAPIAHLGFTPSGFDCGWGIALPVGKGGFQDFQFSGWKPLPPEPKP